MYRVVLVDDERLILEGLSKVVPWKDMDCAVAGTASDGREGLALIRHEQPDIVFTDIRMPNMDGLTMLAALHSEFPRMQMTVLTAYRDFDYAQQAITLGVCRYLLKPSKMEEITQAIQIMTARLRELPPEKTDDSEPESGEAGSFIVRSALEFMQRHCTEHISLTDVADSVYVSQWHLSKLINRHTGQSFFDLLGSMRIERAKELLADPAMRVHAVAEAVGYSDVAHFSKSFKKIVGKTPGEYRSSLSNPG
ncbi:MAG: response regulator [Candidatus Ventricola sp.]